MELRETRKHAEVTPAPNATFLVAISHKYRTSMNDVMGIISDILDF